LASTNEFYRKRGRETTNKNPNSPNLSQKSASAKNKPQSSGLEERRTSTENLDDGGDKDPTEKTMEKSHVVHNSIKRKKRNSEKSDIFLKFFDLTKELDGPHLLMDTILLSKEQILEQLEALKVAWDNEFSDSVGFSEEDIERWLVRYINKNNDIEDTLHQLSIDLGEFENELFETKTKHEITISPMREYI
jgi:hypothetical protein